MVIGEGGHSKVYKANIKDGKVVLVKVLSSDPSSDDLVQEVKILSEIKHEKIVHIVGFCNDKNIKAIVYNFLKRSLKQYLRTLEWKERVRIAIGIAKVLNCLHHSCDPPIIHIYVKSSNILLFDNFIPQVSQSHVELLKVKQTKNLHLHFYFKSQPKFGFLTPS